MRPEARRREERNLPPVARASKRRGWRARLAWWLRCAADRIDTEGGFRCMSPYSFTFERGKGIRLREDGHGTPLWYWGPDRERSYEEADTDWRPAWEVIGSDINRAFQSLADEFRRMAR